VGVVLNETANVYREWAPHPALAASVVCTWADPPRVRPQPVLPDACIDLVWDGETLCVAGPDTAAVRIAPSASFVGIRFRPGAAPGFLRVGADELVDARVDLADLWGPSAVALQDQLLAAPHRATALLERALLGRLPSAADPDPLVNALLAEITCSPELAAPDEAAGQRFAASLGVSQRTLRRRCTTALGYGPKTLERILRFRRALRMVRSGSPLVDVAREAGYADQSHLTNESQRLAGLTPGTLAARPTFSLAANGLD
jgi:AraC-like DNA-binding protein